MAYPDILRQRLDAAINYVVENNENKEKYIRNPGVDFTRDRKLTMQDTIALLLSMSGGSLKKELYTSGVDATASAFVQSRAKLLPKAFEAVFHRFNLTCNDRKTYRGTHLHLFCVDGSCINLSRDPDAPSFVQNDSNPRGYNQLHLNAWFDLENSTYRDAVIDKQPRADEIGAAIKMIKRNDFHGQNLVIFDRGYESYNLFAHCLQKQNLDFLCRIKQDKSCMKMVQGLPMEEFDRQVAFVLTTTQRKIDIENGYVYIQTHKNRSKKYSAKTRAGRWDFASPYLMGLRIVRFLLPTGGEDYETVVTSLPKSFTTEEIKVLYAKRWGIETSFRNLKYCQNLVNLHGKSDTFAEQEIFAALTMCNFSSRIAGAVVVAKKATNMYAYQVNFTMATFLCKIFYRNKQKDGELLLKEINGYVEPVRPGRTDKRKIRPKGFVGFIYRVAA